MITLKLLNLDEVRRAHERLITQNDALMHQVSSAGGIAAKVHVNTQNRFVRRTGHLQESTTTSIVRLTSGRILRLGNTAKYADPIEHGARAHWIPKLENANAKILHFYWEKMGRWVSCERVWHPGNRAYRFMSLAWRHAEAVELMLLKIGMRSIAKRF